MFMYHKNSYNISVELMFLLIMEKIFCYNFILTDKEANHSIPNKPKYPQVC